ncbi:alpha/beta hydrolase family esterase [Spongiivirga citrea]|uniref:Phospholipase/carboxylesterase/thioesterase domain-containing protein n=1 Tax=Spongiivirga citrea TaxID=1481457 RepID=A0A6M0CU21_9FLAO|nr:PHB depolymerase family esterase [Spongiivirga citrea]NER17270.1 hypothetical protein [Spongiivirga citrea]
MNKITPISYLFLPIIFSLCFGCNKDDSSKVNTVINNVGSRIDITTMNNGDERTYIIYIPSTYNPEKEHPLVFQLHGGSGNGEKFYNISGWNDIAEENGLIIVYPTSFAYDMKNNGCGNNRVTHWNNYNLPSEVCNVNDLRDETNFLNQVINEVKASYTIDESRIYMAGFSRGSGMVNRLGIELSNKITAVGGLAGFLPGDTIYTPQRKLPIHIMLGTLDEKIASQTIFNTEIPFDLDEMLDDPGLKDILKTYIASYNLDPNYTLIHSSASGRTYRFEGNSGAPENVMLFSLLKDVTHVFPNPPIEAGAADIFWKFFQQYSL